MDFNNEEIFSAVVYNLKRALTSMDITGPPSAGRIAGCSEALEALQRAEHFYTYLIQQAIEEEE